MNDNNKIEPKLRFPGFTDAWEQRKLGDVLDDLYNGQTPSRANNSFWNGDINWLSSGELNRGTVFETIEKITEDGRKDANLRIVSKGTFLMAITGLEAAGTRGNCAILGMDTTLNQSCMALYPNKKLLNSSFLFQWYRKVGEEYGIRYTQGTKQQSYNAELIKILPITLPSVGEQIKIAEFLNTLDHTITLHQRKLKHLQERKKALLQKMFPKNGESYPEIRFPGFTDAWEHRKLGELVNITTGKLDANAMVENGKYDFYTSGMKKYKINTPAFEGPAITIAGNGATVGYMHYADGPFNAYQRTYVLNEFRANREFLFQAIRNTLPKKIKQEARTGNIPYIVMGMLTDLKIKEPSIQEQQKIGAFFKQLDDTITIHQRKLEHLQERKKALLQQMFI